MSRTGAASGSLWKGVYSLSQKSDALKAIDFWTPTYADKMIISDVFPTNLCRQASKSVCPA